MSDELDTSCSSLITHHLLLATALEVSDEDSAARFALRVARAFEEARLHGGGRRDARAWNRRDDGPLHGLRRPGAAPAAAQRPFGARQRRGARRARRAAEPFLVPRLPRLQGSRR